MKDKGAPAGGVPVKASAKRGARQKAEAPAGGTRGGREQAAGGPQSAMQAFKSAVKKAANKMKGRKTRRG